MKPTTSICHFLSHRRQHIWYRQTYSYCENICKSFLCLSKSDKPLKHRIEHYGTVPICRVPRAHGKGQGHTAKKCVCKGPGREPLRLSVGRPFAVCPDPGHTANNVFVVCPDPRHKANKFLLNLNFTQLIRFQKLFYQIKLNDQSKNIAKYRKQLMFYDSNKKTIISCVSNCIKQIVSISCLNKFDLIKFTVCVSQSA